MFIRSRKPTEAATIPLEIGGLRVRASARAKRMGLRVEARTGDVVFTWPLKSRLTPDRALKFIEENRGWIAQQKSQAVAPKNFAAGAVVPVAGKNYTIVHAAGRGLTRFEDDRLIVHGQPEHVARRVKDFLKGVALDTLSRLTQEKSASLGLKNASIRILDPKSRWGSCAPGGKIMYSWRLILAPHAVMDYVVAHEVAHRVHMNHSRQFWRVCVSLAPKSRECRAWLRREGRELLAWR